jgi:hypothetical protein
MPSEKPVEWKANIDKIVIPPKRNVNEEDNDSSDDGLEDTSTSTLPPFGRLWKFEKLFRPRSQGIESNSETPSETNNRTIPKPLSRNLLPLSSEDALQFIDNLLADSLSSSEDFNEQDIEEEEDEDEELEHNNISNPLIFHNTTNPLYYHTIKRSSRGPTQMPPQPYQIKRKADHTSDDTIVDNKKSRHISK